MPPWKDAIKGNNEGKGDVQQDELDLTKEFLLWMKQQMTVLAQKNDATNAKLETLSM